MWKLNYGLNEEIEVSSHQRAESRQMTQTDFTEKKSRADLRPFGVSLCLCCGSEALSPDTDDSQLPNC